MASDASRAGSGWTRFPESKRSWVWLFALGISLIFLGTAAIVFSVAATVAYVIVFGVILMLSGALQVVHAFFRPKWSGLFLDLFTGILSLVVGFLLAANPLLGAEALTLLIAAFLFVGGVFRIVAALAGQFRNRGWMLVNGIINVVLGVLIWAQWPLSGLWIIGLFVGIDMLFNGWSLVMLGMLAKDSPETAH